MPTRPFSLSNPFAKTSVKSAPFSRIPLFYTLFLSAVVSREVPNSAVSKGEKAEEEEEEEETLEWRRGEGRGNVC